MIDFTYQFNDKQQLEYRNEQYHSAGTWKGFREDFTYDAVNRLDTASISGIDNPPPALSMEYAHAGQDRITQKSGIGTFTYQEGTHKISEIAAAGTYHPANDSISYTPEGKVNTLMEGKKSLSFTYGIDDQRFGMEYKVNDTLRYTRYYFDNYEKEVQKDGSTRNLNYIYAAGNQVAIHVQQSGTDSTFFVYTDYLGSLRCITDSAGNIRQCLSFDAWGNRRNPFKGAKDTTIAAYLFSRGFTGHEHLDEFGLINMNGRMYDPALGVFISVDNYIQAPDFTQSFNRYAYCLNNPLMYSDPSGNSWKLSNLLRFIPGGFSVVQYAQMAEAKGYGMGDWQTYAYVAGGSMISGVAAGASLGVGGAVAGLFSNTCFVSGAAAGAAAGFTGGFISGFGAGLMGGQSINDAFLSGLTTGAIGGLAGGIIGGIVGGIQATNDKRNFWHGGKKYEVYLTDKGPVDVADYQAMRNRYWVNNTDRGPQGFHRLTDRVNNNMTLFNGTNPYPNSHTLYVPDGVEGLELDFANSGFVNGQTLNYSVNGGNPLTIARPTGTTYWNSIPLPKGTNTINLYISGSPYTVPSGTIQSSYMVKVKGYYWANKVSIKLW